MWVSLYIIVAFLSSVSHHHDDDKMNDCGKLIAIYRSCTYQQSCVPVVYFTYRIITQCNTRDRCNGIRTKKTTTPSFTSEKSSL
jgi:hypothetical protein